MLSPRARARLVVAWLLLLAGGWAAPAYAQDGLGGGLGDDLGGALGDLGDDLGGGLDDALDDALGGGLGDDLGGGLGDDLGDDLGSGGFRGIDENLGGGLGGLGDIPDLAPSPLPTLGGEPALLPVAPRAGAPSGSGPALGLREVAARAVVEAGLIQRSQLEVAARRREIQAADAGRWPKLGVLAYGRDSDHRQRIGEILGPELSRSLERPLAQIRNDSAFVAGFDVKAPLYRGGLFHAREESARAMADRARAQHLQAVEAVLLRAVDSFLHVMLADARVSLERERERALATSQQEEVAAASTPTLRDTLSLEHELKIARVRSRIAQLEGQADLARARLAALLGPDAPTDLALRPSFDVRATGMTPEAFAAQAARGNLQVKVEMAEAKAARRQVEAEASAYLPTVDLDYSYRHSAPNYDDRVTTDWWEAKVRVDYPLFDGGKARAHKRAASKRAEAADLEVREAARRAKDEALVEARREQRFTRELTRVRRLVDLARRHLRAAQDGADSGGRRPSDVARARVALKTAEVEAFEVQAAVVRSRCRQHALAGQLVLDKF